MKKLIMMLAVLALLVGCNLNNQSPVPAAPAVTGKETPLQLYRAALARTRSLTSLHYTIQSNLINPLAPNAPHFTISGDAVVPDRAQELRISDDGQRQERIKIGNRIYYIIEADHWTFFDGLDPDQEQATQAAAADAVNPGYGATLATEYAETSPLERLMGSGNGWQLYAKGYDVPTDETVKLIGQEQVEGVDCQHISFGAQIAVDWWIANRDMHIVKIEYSDPPGQTDRDVFTYSRINEPIEITAPTNAVPPPTLPAKP